MNARILVPVTLALLLAAGCGGFEEARVKGDAPVGARDDSAAEIVNFPNTYPNVAVKCDGHGHRIYVTTHQTSDVPPVIVTDATCPGGAPS